MVEYNGATVRDYSVDRMPQTLPELKTATADSNSITAGESTLNRREVVTAGVGTATQQVRLTFFTAVKTETISNVVSITAGQAAAATPTLARIGVYVEETNGDLTLVAATANDTSLWSATNTVYTQALIAPFTKERGRRYAVGILIVTGVTTPILYGNSVLLAAIAFVAPKLSALITGQADLPASILNGSLATSGVSTYVALTP